MGAFPISIDVERFERMASSPDSESRVARLRDRYAKRSRQLGICVDRIDYTKVNPERICVLGTMWADLPELRERITFIFVGTPSRTELPTYATLERDVLQSIISINERFGSGDWTPIVFINENVESDLLTDVYHAAESVHRLVAAGRNEPRRQGVRCLSAR